MNNRNKDNLNNTEYYLIDQDSTATQRIKGRKEQAVNACKAADCISFHPHGAYVKWATVKYFPGSNQIEDKIPTL